MNRAGWASILAAVCAAAGVPAVAAVPAAPTCLTGTLTYSRPDAEAGPHLPVVTAPARNANWALYDSAHPSPDDVPLAASLTDTAGRFRACATGVAGSDLYLVFRAQSSTLWEVLDDDGAEGEPHTFTVPLLAVSGSRELGDIAVPAALAGAWKIVDTMNLLWWNRPAAAGSCWTSHDDSESCERISFVWPSVSGQPGGVSYFTTLGFVYLTAADADTRHVTLHEAGHYFQWLWQGKQWAEVNNCSPHYINLVSSPSCAFTEGFADAVAAYTLGDNRYVWSNGQSADFENDAFTPNWDSGSATQGRVSSSLLDLWRGPDGGWDRTLELLTTMVPADFHDYFYNGRPTVGLSTTGAAARILREHTADRPSPGYGGAPRSIDGPIPHTPIGPRLTDRVEHDPRQRAKPPRPEQPKHRWTQRKPHGPTLG
ncbi:hypothetical protein [Nocardia sp. NPDC050435]|uniref:hypothetical protein n=1 Tax=Nocardia sp. NPDC050435 TaxID=3155040 RepID=UPI003407A95C